MSNACKTIIIGSFNMSSYSDFASVAKGDDILFFHAEASWFIKDETIRKKIIMPGDLIEQKVLEELYDDSFTFMRDTAKAGSQFKFKGINFIEILRFRIVRTYQNIVEACLILSELIKKYQPAAVILDPSCQESVRCKIYAEVAEYLFKEEKADFRYNYTAKDKSVNRSNVFELVRQATKDNLRGLLSFMVNSINDITPNRDTIIFCGAFHQFEEILKWFSETKTYRLIYFKESIPFKKIGFLLRNRVLWHRINETSDGRADLYKGGYAENLAERLFNSDDTINRFFKGRRFLADILRRYISDELNKNWKVYTSLLDISSRVFKERRVKGVFVDEDQMPVARIVVDSANLHNKQTFIICHGILDEKTNFIFSAKNIYTYGSKASQWIKEYSRDFNPNVIEVGMPRLDRLKLLDTSWARNRLCKDLCIDRNKKIILFTPGNMSFKMNFYANNVKKNRQSVHFRTLIKLKELVARDKRLHIILKLHPGTTKGREYSYYRETLFKREGLTTVEGYDIDILVKGCDILVHCLTTVAYHGLVACKPIVRVRGEVENILWELLDSNAEEVIRLDSSDFNERVLNLLFDEGKAKLLCDGAESYMRHNHGCEDLNVKNRLLGLTSALLANNLKTSDIIDEGSNNVEIASPSARNDKGVSQ